MGPMEILRVISVVLNTLKFLNTSVEKFISYLKKQQDLKIELDALVKDLEELESGLQEGGWKNNDDELSVRELVYDIEDFTLDLHTLGVSGALKSMIGMDPHVNIIKKLRDDMDRLLKRKDNGTESKPEQGGGSDPASSSAPEEYTRKYSLVGISKPRNLLLDLLKVPASSEQAGGQDAKKLPKVISIVGCPGVGKTALAKAVYDHYVASATSCDDFDHHAAEDACASDGFKCVAWVDAAGCNDKMALLGKILKKVQADLASRASRSPVPSEGDGNAASQDLRDILADKRYLVFIDDIQKASLLQDIRENHFPKNDKSGMVIITTSVRQVADVYSSGSYVYRMNCLSNYESENLFQQAFNQAKGERVSPGKLYGSTSIITKFGGLPLVLISVVEHLSLHYTKVDYDFYSKVAKELGNQVAGNNNTEEEFLKLRRALGKWYESLRGYDHKNYMYSLSIFPRNHSIKCKSLVRRLVAEGLVANYDRKYLDELINRCIVEPVQISSRSNDVKSCKVDVGIMLEFIIQKSLSTNFVTLIREKEVVCGLKGRIRRLSVQSSTKDKFKEVALKSKEFKTIKSLTIISSEGRSELFEIVKCKFLRLLDLEDCRWVDDEFFEGICELFYLKYLSLRRTNIKKIPRQINNLLCLETMDIRGTEKIELREEVITLPKLAFLFGKFVLPKMSKRTVDFLLTESKLDTIAGFVVDQWNGFEHIILKAKNLRKVKVRCTDTSNDVFLSSLRNFESVSIESDQLSTGIIASLEGPNCIISRMKLWGKLGSLPCLDMLQMIDTLRKLQLSCTGLTSEVLSSLQHITRLQYLKLHEDKKGSWDGKFHVLGDGFECLLLLCFDAPKLPELQFDKGSMQSLTSLHLNCEDISLMRDVEEISQNIKHITSLNEVILHYSATEAIVDAWKTAAKSNPSRPRVSKALRDQ